MSTKAGWLVRGFVNAPITAKTQLNDALIESYRVYGWGYVLNHPVTEEKGEYARTLRRWLHEYRGVTTHTS